VGWFHQVLIKYADSPISILSYHRIILKHFISGLFYRGVAISVLDSVIVWQLTTRTTAWNSWVPPLDKLIPVPHFITILDVSHGQNTKKLRNTAIICHAWLSSETDTGSSFSSVLQQGRMSGTENRKRCRPHLWMRMGLYFMGRSPSTLIEYIPAKMVIWPSLRAMGSDKHWQGNLMLTAESRLP